MRNIYNAVELDCKRTDYYETPFCTIQYLHTTMSDPPPDMASLPTSAIKKRSRTLEQMWARSL